MANYSNWYGPNQASSSYLSFFFPPKPGFSEQMFRRNKFSLIQNNHLLLLPENMLMKGSQKTKKKNRK